MSIALCVIGNGRIDGLHRVIQAALNYLPEFDHYLMVDDSGEPNIARELFNTYPKWQIHSHDTNRGMAAAIQTGFDLVTANDADFVFWLEEDMLLTGSPPIEEAMQILSDNEQLAQICFRREPVDINPTEIDNGCVLKTLVDMSSHVMIHDKWTEYDGLFSLNPSLIPIDICQQGWDPDNEAGMTRKLTSGGYTFGSWGHPNDQQTWVRHIGHQRAAQWQL